MESEAQNGGIDVDDQGYQYVREICVMIFYIAKSILE